MIAEFISYRISLADFADFFEQHAGDMFGIMATHLPLRGAFAPGSGTMNRMTFLAFHEDYKARDTGWSRLAEDAKTPAHHGGPGGGTGAATGQCPRRSSGGRNARSDRHDRGAVRRRAPEWAGGPGR